MKDKIEELLAVLDMPEEEQNLWLVKNKYFCDGDIDYAQHYVKPQWDMLKADLAFRLRDEATESMPWVPDKNNTWYKAVKIVVNKVQEDNTKCDILEQLGWLANFGDPIHWIIAALIARNLAKVLKAKDG